jgi:hypothetical protein
MPKESDPYAKRSLTPMPLCQKESDPYATYAIPPSLNSRVAIPRLAALAWNDNGEPRSLGVT